MPAWESIVARVRVTFYSDFFMVKPELPDSSAKSITERVIINSEKLALQSISLVWHHHSLDFRTAGVHYPRNEHGVFCFEAALRQLVAYRLEHEVWTQLQRTMITLHEHKDTKIVADIQAIELFDYPRKVLQAKLEQINSSNRYTKNKSDVDS